MFNYVGRKPPPVNSQQQFQQQAASGLSDQKNNGGVRHGAHKPQTKVSSARKSKNGKKKNANAPSDYKYQVK